jgi:F-type H+-transporting ATPase subunit alpha
MRNAKSDVVAAIKEKKALDEGLIATLGAAIEEFKKGFKA